RCAVESFCREGDAELLRLLFDGSKVRARRRRGGVRIADLGAGSGIEGRGAVTHAAAHHMLGDEATEDVSEHRPKRIAAARGLEADEAAARSGDADGAASVVGMCERYNSRRYRRCRSTRRTAGRMI